MLKDSVMKAIFQTSLLQACLLIVSTLSAHAFYEPGVQRWLNRDRVGERGGVNLYRPMANNTIGNFDVDGRTWRPASRPPRVIDGGSIYCMNGKPVPYIPKSKQLTPTELDYLEKDNPGYTRSYNCYMDCIRRHEQSHADDALGENPNICTGVPNGTFVINDDPTALHKSELTAHAISKKCLQDCKKTCPGHHVDEGLRLEKEWEDKYVRQ